jgi:hypothetical protein
MAMPGRDTARGSQSADRGAPARQRAAVLATPETNSDDRAVGAASQMREITDVLSKLADPGVQRAKAAAAGRTLTAGVK